MNLTYLNHEFIEYHKYECKDFICKKCGVVIFYSFNQDSEFYYTILDGYDIMNSLGEHLTIGCDEMIIKNIIE